RHLLFFLQAEDRIRSPLVTGFQTCALPIFPESQSFLAAHLPPGSFPHSTLAPSVPTPASLDQPSLSSHRASRSQSHPHIAPDARSEERRAGNIIANRAVYDIPQRTRNNTMR